MVHIRNINLGISVFDQSRVEYGHLVRIKLFKGLLGTKSHGYCSTPLRILKYSLCEREMFFSYHWISRYFWTSKERRKKNCKRKGK